MTKIKKQMNLLEVQRCCQCCGGMEEVLSVTLLLYVPGAANKVIAGKRSLLCGFCIIKGLEIDGQKPSNTVLMTQLQEVYKRAHQASGGDL